jgi:hypothetical protein
VQVDDVGLNPVRHRTRQAGFHESRPVELELNGGYVGDDDSGADPRQLNRESPWTRPDVEDRVASAHKAMQVVVVDVRTRRAASTVIEACPFALAILIVERGSTDGVVVHG